MTRTRTRSWLAFGDLRLDAGTQELHYRGVTSRLRRKSFDVLLHLARNADRFVPAEEIHDAVWRTTIVSPTVMRVCIREIRAALGTHAHLLLSTTHRGYRLLVGTANDVALARLLVGRAAELESLRVALAQAMSGRPQIAFVVGAAGAGKTALIERFLDEVRAQGVARIAETRAYEGVSGEAYAAVLQLLHRLCDPPDGEAVRQHLARWAPTWLLQMPGWVDDATREHRPHVAPATPVAMLRQLGDLIEQLTRTGPLVLAIEDLHWSDAYTIEALAYLAERSDTMPLLLLGSYRSDHPGLAQHRLTNARQRLRARRVCREIPVGPLAREHVTEYLRHRLPGAAPTDRLVDAVSRHSDGHALFLVTMIDHLLERGQLTRADGGEWRLMGSLDGMIPDEIAQLIALQLATSTAKERRLLEAASIVGAEFETGSVAAASGLPVTAVETACSALAEAGRLVAKGVVTRPDGTVSARYEFPHAVYAEVLYRGLGATVCMHGHRAVGRHLEAMHGARARELAAVIARHYALGGDSERAMRFHAEAAMAAGERFAAHIAIAHLEAALTLLRAGAAPHAHVGEELGFLLQLAAEIVGLRGYAGRDVASAYARALELAVRRDFVPAQITALAGLYAHDAMRADLASAHARAESLLALIDRTPAPLFTVFAHTAMGNVLFHRGEFSAARTHLDRADAAWDPDMTRLPVDVPMLSQGLRALTLFVLGDVGAATSALDKMLARATVAPADFSNLAQAHSIAAQFHATVGNREAARPHAERALALAEEHELPPHRGPALVVLGWATGDVALIQQGLSRYETVGHRLGRSLFHALLAETQLERADAGGALRTLDEALAFAAESGEARHLAELHRLRGLCLLTVTKRATRRGRTCANGHDAIASLRMARDIARRQRSLVWYRRANTALRASSGPIHQESLGR